MSYDYDEYESLPKGANLYNYMLAGAAAGIMEHCCMYPIDSVKTRMQSLVSYKLYEGKGLLQSLSQIIKSEGWCRPIKGINVVFMGAGPAHALYFSSYEAIKEYMLNKTSNNVVNANYNIPSTVYPIIQNPLIKTNKDSDVFYKPKSDLAASKDTHIHDTLVHGIAGTCATLLHDAIMNPVEVVKQRLQSFNTPYSGVINCASEIYKNEGSRAFYRSYGTQLTLNIPFQVTHFVTYEFCRRKFYEARQNKIKASSILNQPYTSHTSYYDPLAHLVSGGIAGGLAAAITNPLDVCKTLLNTQEFLVHSTHPEARSTNGSTSTNKTSNICRKLKLNDFPNNQTKNFNKNATAYVATHNNIKQPINGASSIRYRLNNLNSSCITVLSTLSSARPQASTVKSKNFDNNITRPLVTRFAPRETINGLFEAAKTIYSIRGFRGFAQGLQARCVYQMPATAFSWSVYEFFKYILSKNQARIHSKS